MVEINLDQLQIIGRQAPEEGWFVDAVIPGKGPLGHALCTFGDRTLTLDQLHVFACLRGNGIGEKIFQAVENIGKQKGMHQLTGEFKPETGEETRARAFYEKMGVEITPNGKIFKNLD